MASRHHSRLWTAVLALTLLTGCGHDDQPAAPTSVNDGAQSAAAAPPSAASTSPSPANPTPAERHTNSTTRPTTRSTTKPQPQPATERQLRKIVVQASELPSGFSRVEGLSMLNADANAEIARCLGVRDTTPNIVAVAESGSFADGATQIQSIAASYPSKADLDVDFGMLTNPRLQPCLERFTRLVYEQLGWTVDSISVKVTLRPAGTPSNVVGIMENTLSGTIAGRDLVAHERTAFIRGHLLEAQVQIAAIDQPIPGPLWTSILSKIATRAAAT